MADGARPRGGAPRPHQGHRRAPRGLFIAGVGVGAGGAGFPESWGKGRAQGPLGGVPPRGRRGTLAGAMGLSHGVPASVGAC